MAPDFSRERGVSEIGPKKSRDHPLWCVCIVSDIYSGEWKVVLFFFETRLMIRAFSIDVFFFCVLEYVGNKTISLSVSLFLFLDLCIRGHRDITEQGIPEILFSARFVQNENVADTSYVIPFFCQGPAMWLVGSSALKPRVFWVKLLEERGFRTRRRSTMGVHPNPFLRLL